MITLELIKDRASYKYTIHVGWLITTLLWKYLMEIVCEVSSSLYR